MAWNCKCSECNNKIHAYDISYHWSKGVGGRIEPESLCYKCGEDWEVFSEYSSGQRAKQRRSKLQTHGAV